MITIVQPLPVGNAIRLFLAPPAGALRWKVLRKGSDDFSGHDDPAAIVVHDGNERVVVDATALQNNVLSYYQAFYTADGVVWSASATASGIAAAIYQEQTTDVLAFLRQRLEAGLLVECQRGNFQTDFGMIQVINSAPAMTPDLRFPLVTIHLDDESPEERGIGELVGIDAFDGIAGDWIDSEGWLAGVKVTVIGWSLNADERIELRKAIRRILLANLPVFEAQAWTGFSFNLQDMDALGNEYGVNMYQVLASISVTAPVVVSGVVAPISDVVSTATAFQEVPV